MAGGSKETPRQKMIGMMYLVLTALLALQVSNAVLDKFIFIDQSLQHSVAITRENSQKSLNGIRDKVEKNGYHPADKAVQAQAETVHKLTNDLMQEIVKTRQEIEKVTGGRDPKDGKLIGAKDYDKQMAYTIGKPDLGQKGRAYELQKLMNGYIDQLKALDDSLKDLEYLALDAKDIPEFKNDPVQNKKDFAYLNFDHTPTVACMAVLSQMQSEVAQVEQKVLEKFAAKVGADQLKFDKVIAVVTPNSRVVAAGTKYTAELFIAASSSKLIPTMTYNGKGLKVEDGKGKIEFMAQASTYDAEGNSKQKYKACITIPRPTGDTTICREEEFVVAKPVVQVQAGAVAALYLQCGNELNIQVPALGANYDPSFTADAAELIPGSKKGFVTVVPTNPKGVALGVFSGGNQLSTEKFPVRPVPLPTLKVFVNGKEADLKNGIPATSRSMEVRPIPDATFATMLPKDARYRITEMVVTLGRGRRAIVEKRLSEGNANSAMTEIAAQAKEGDRIVIEVKQVKRMNFKNSVENVALGTEIINVPIQ